MYFATLFLKKMDISIITINYNNSYLFIEFLKTLEKYISEKIEYEVIIVDNNSKAQDYEALQKIIASQTINIKLHKSKINLGFGGGNMLGHQFATGTYLAFINNDIVFTEDCFTPLLSFIKNNKNIGACTPQQYNGKEEPVSGLDYFHGIRKELLGRSFLEKTLPKNTVKRGSFPYTQNSKADFIQGCFMFFKADFFNEVGGFDTNLFLYFEEMDICYRLKEKGYNSYVIPSSSFTHLHGASTKPSLSIQQELVISKMYIYRKNYTLFKFKILQLILSIKWFFKTLFKPSIFKILLIIIGGGHIKHPLKQKQVIS